MCVSQFVQRVVSVFCRSVLEVFALLGCYAALIGSYQCYGMADLSHLQDEDGTDTLFPKRR